MRISYITETYPPEINAVAKSAERTVQHLRHAGHAVLVIRPRQCREAAIDSDTEWRTAGGSIPLYPELRYGLAGVAAFRASWKRRGRPDLVHVATPGPLGHAALRAARAEGVPATADFRTDFDACSRHCGLGWLAPPVLRYLRRLHTMADCSFVPTSELAARLAGQGFERLQVVGRGVDAQCFSPAWRDPWLRRAWRAGPSPVLLHVGRLAPENNVRLALLAFERLREHHPALRMVVVGDGPARASLQSAHPEVRFVGRQRGQDLARHYASADVLLFPSLTDTFGNVIPEAMASGLAVVAFDTAAARRHVRDGVNGWLAPFETGNAQAVGVFQAAVARALDFAQPASTVRLQARQTAQRLPWSQVLAGFEQKLLAVAGRTAPQMPLHAAAA